MGLFSGITSFVGDALGSVVGNVFNRNERKSAQRFSAHQSATQWQRTVSDMKAAGINPMLAVHQGPNSSPSSTGSPQSFKEVSSKRR